MNRECFLDFFEKKIYREDWKDCTDKNIVLDFFEEYINETMNLTDKIRLICYQNELCLQDIDTIFDNKSYNHIKKTLSLLNKQNHLIVKKINGVNYYTTTSQGLQILLVNCSNFGRNNEYLKQQTKNNINNIPSEKEELDEEKIKEISKSMYTFFSSSQEKKKIINAITLQSNRYEIDFADIIIHDYRISELLIEKPQEVIKIMEETLKLFAEIEQNYEIKIRLKNIPECQNIEIGSQRKDHIDKLISFSGVIRRKSDVKPRLKYLEYLCTNPSCNFCENKIKVPQFEEKARKLKNCPKCKSSLELINKQLEDSMILILEQDFNSRNDDFDTKKIHIKINSDLTEDGIYKKLKISEKIQIIGILKEIPKNTNTGADSVNYDYILEANNIIFNSSDNEKILTQKDIEEIKEFAKKPNCFDEMIESFLPNIYNNKNIKKALLLQHIGSSFDNQRNNSHILLLGDPSTGKSEMISENLTYSSRGIYSSGTSSTKVGLTATIIKDDLTGSWVLEPGVLPRANGGIVGLDELDKISKEDGDCLTEALEQQRITISKANIHTTLDTKTSLLAGANPKKGKFDMETDIKSQINFNSALLSRFDLIFVLKDNPNKKNDEELISHIIDSYDIDLIEEARISKDFIKKYIYYCKINFNPQLSNEAKKLIKEYYVNIRQQTSSVYDISFTPRQIKGVIRFASSLSKFKQKNIIDIDEITFAFKLFNETLSDIGLLNNNIIQDRAIIENINNNYY